jgi:hypothetical protein
MAEELVARGFSRLDQAVAERLRTLATSAHGVDLPRLERALRALGDEVARSVARDVSASDEAVLARAALVHALSRALVRPRPALVGQHRARYEPARELELVGLGAEAWRTASGYRGLTVFFWNASSRAFATLSEARPERMDFDPAARFRGPGPWLGCPSPKVASESRIVLRSAWKTRGGRLSGRTSTSMTRLGPSVPDGLNVATDWSALAAQARAGLVARLGEPGEHGALALLRPAAWGPPTFDPIAQRSRRALRDAAGHTLALELPFGPETRAAIAAVEALQPSPDTHLFGRLRVSGGDLCLFPISTLDESGVRSLGLESVVAAAAAPAGVEDQEDDEPDQELEGAAEGPADEPVGRTLARARGELEAIAATGAGARHDLAALAAARAEVSALGLARVTAALEAVERAGRARATLPAALLEAAWVVHVAQSATVVERAAARLV